MKKRRGQGFLCAMLIAIAGLLSFSTLAHASSGSGTSVVAEIKGKLDTRNAKVGDTLMAKTLGGVTLPNGTAIPAGSMLVGKVTRVQSKSAGNGVASIDITFDEARPKKKGAAIPVHGVLVAIAPVRSLSDGGPSTSGLPMASNRPVGNYAGETGAKVGGDDSSMPSIGSGSSVRGVALAPENAQSPGMLSSTSKDIKLSNGMRIGVMLSGQ